MEDFDIQPKLETNKKADLISALANEILVKIFCYLQLQDAMKLSLVCKRWATVSSSDALWQKFVPKCPPGVTLPKAESLKELFRKLWSNSIQIGQERWFPNPLPGLVEYNTLLQKYNEETWSETQYEVFTFSKCLLYLRLNPLYPFTTDGIKHDDPLMQEMVYKISDKLGHIPRRGYGRDEEAYVFDETSLIQLTFLTDRQFVMKAILTFCYDFKTEEFSFWDKEQLTDEEGHCLEKDLSDDEQVGIVPHPLIEKGMSLSKRLFNQIWNVFIDKNYRFISYCVNTDYRSEIEDLPYTRQFFVSDTAVVYCARRRMATCE